MPTQPNTNTLAERPWTFCRIPGAGVSNSTRDPSLKSPVGPPVSVHDPIAVVEGDDPAPAGERRSHLEILPVLVLPVHRGQEVQLEGGVHQTKRLPGDM